MSGSLDKVRIAVIGDSGVGKTTLVHALAHGEILSNAPWTIGCSAEVLLYDFKQASAPDKSVFIELWDVGGSTSHKNSRSIFYNSINGAILVHDLSNKKSYQNLRKWFSELVNLGRQEFTGVHVKNGNNDSNGGNEFDIEEFSGNTLPVIIVGTKLDQAPQSRIASGYCGLARELGATQVSLDCLQKRSLSIGSQNWDTISKFFDKVIERRLAKNHSVLSPQHSFDVDSPRSSIADKRRKMFTALS